MTCFNNSFTEKTREYLRFFQKNHTNSFEVLQGSGKIALSAPHSTEHLRNGKIRFAEPHTGVIAKLLHDELGLPVAYKTKNLGDDANYDENCEYKKAMKELVQTKKVEVLIDLHQLSPTRKTQINLGTNGFKNLNDRAFADIFFEEFSKREITPRYDYPFSASSPRTVSAFIREQTAINCIQLEINSSLLIEECDNYKFCEVYSAIKNAIFKTADYLESK